MIDLKSHNMNLNKNEQIVFEEMVKRDWKILSALRCEVAGCFNEIEYRVGWDEHMFDDVHMCKEHFDKFLSFFNWYKNQLRKERGEFYEWEAEYMENVNEK